MIAILKKFWRLERVNCTAKKSVELPSPNPQKDLEVTEKIVRHVVKGALHNCINSHGPVTKELIGSVQKRILNGLRSVAISHLIEQYKRESIEKSPSSFYSLIVDKRIKELEEIIKAKDAGIKYWKKKAGEE